MEGLGGLREGDVVQRAAMTLREEHWDVKPHPLFGAARPDLLLVDPHGHQFIAELKFGMGSNHFGALAQVSSYARLAKDLLGSPVRAILITDRPLETRLA